MQLYTGLDEGAGLFGDADTLKGEGMEPALVKGFEMGTHMVPITFESPLCWIFWACLLLGFGMQLLLQRKRHLRFLWLGFLLAALAACEIVCQVMIGWDLILCVLLHFYILSLLLGALGGLLLRRIRQSGQKRRAS